MSVAVRGRVPVKWNEQTARHITERLQALERLLAGGAAQFVAPTVPTYGTGTITGGGGGGGGGGVSGASDHGSLSGLSDDDHGQYVQHLESPVPRSHTHRPDEILLLDHSFVRRIESVRPLAHTHRADEILDLPQPERRSVPSHVHTAGQVVDLRPDDASFVFANRVFGG